MSLSKVDLPQPLGPTIATKLPVSTDKSTAASAAGPSAPLPLGGGPNRLVTPVTAMAAAPAVRRWTSRIGLSGSVLPAIIRAPVSRGWKQRR